MLEIAVIEDSDAAEASLDPIRSRLLAELTVPLTGTALAARVGLPRQKVNYHIRALEKVGLVELVEERRKGNVTERVVQSRAASFVISPAALSAVQPNPARGRDRLSAEWMLALAARLVRDVGALITGAAAANKRLATFALDAELRFASAQDRARFVEELAADVAVLTAKYHNDEAPAGRNHRLVVALHPTLRTPGAAAIPAIETGARPEHESREKSHGQEI